MGLFARAAALGCPDVPFFGRSWSVHLHQHGILTVRIQ